jgi:hypothetical protein
MGTLHKPPLWSYYLERDITLSDKGKEKLGKHGMFDSLWLGPYMIREIVGPNSFYLSHLDGKPMNIPRNGQQLKLFLQ